MKTPASRITQHSTSSPPQDTFSSQQGQKEQPPAYGVDFADSQWQPIQRITAPGPAAPDFSPGGLSSNRTGLPNTLKSGVEALSGYSLDKVRVHFNSDKPAGLNALAYTQGTEIHIAPGQERHLPHEAWHVVQQAQGRVQATRQLKGMAVNDDKGLEQEADMMGAKALTAHSGVSPDPSSRRLPALPEPLQQQTGTALQRRIGFELETGIPVSEELAGGAAYGMLNNDELEAPYPGGKLMVDHLPGHTASAFENFTEWNIIEFVTDPINDNLSENNFRGVAATWIANLQALSVYAQANFGPVQNAPNVGIPGNLNIRIGIPPGGEALPANLWDRFSPQATMGIKLKNIGRIFEAETLAGGFPGQVRHNRIAQGAQLANNMANDIMDDIHALYPQWHHRQKSGYKELQGLMVLICNYILAGAANAGLGGYAKNHTTMMYKTMLSSVRNDIVHKTYPNFMLGDAAKRPNIITCILNRTNRLAGDEVFQGTTFHNNPILTGAWLNSILAGGMDLVFMANKNPWSNEIGPENVHGKKAAVMEMRDTMDFNLSPLGINGLNDTANIIDYLALVYLQNRQWARR